MKIKLNKFERIAGLFVIGAFAGGVGILGYVAIKQGWFETRIDLTSSFHQADGIYPGSKVQMAGIQVGKVESVELRENNQIYIMFNVSQKFFGRIRKDSVVRVTRPFIIGEKVLDVTVGNNSEPPVLAMAELPTEDNIDLLDMLSGKRMGPYLNMMTDLLGNMKTIMTAFVDPKRAQRLIDIFDSLHPLVVNTNRSMISLNKMSQSLNQDQRLEELTVNLISATRQIKGILPDDPRQFQVAVKEFSQDTRQVMRNMSQLTEAMNTLIPTLNAIAPELPQASKRAIEALNEAVIVLKAMQKSFLLKGSVADVKEEETKRLPSNAEEKGK